MFILIFVLFSKTKLNNIINKRFFIIFTFYIDIVSKYDTMIKIKNEKQLCIIPIIWFGSFYQVPKNPDYKENTLIVFSL